MHATNGNNPARKNQFGQTISLLKLYLPPVLVLCFGLSVTIYFFAYTNKAETEQMVADFNHEAQSRISALNEIVEDNILAVEALNSFYISSYEVERSEFKEYTGHLISHYRGIQTLQWIPRVPFSQKEVYENAAREDGVSGFMVTELAGDGTIVAASKRQEYFPVYFVEPYKGNEDVLGFDLGSDSSSLEALQTARDAGSVTATSRIKLVQEGRQQFEVLIVSPIYRKNAPLDTARNKRDALKGFVLGEFKIADLLEEGISQFEPSGIDMHFFDDSSSPGDRFLYTHFSGLTTKRPKDVSLNETDIKRGFHFEGTINVADRRWVVYFLPTDNFVLAHKTSHPWWILGGGMLFSSLLAGYIASIIGLMAKTKRQADEISHSKELLEQEIIERERAEEQLRHVQKMEAIGTLTAGIAHEYNNILTAIKGYSEFIEEEISGNDKLLKYVDIIKKSVVRAQRMTQHLLAYSRKQKVDYEYININEVLKHIQVLLEHLKAENIRFDFSTHEADLMLMADRSQMEQVFMNLATNAIDAMPGGGTLSIYTDHVKCDESLSESLGNIVPGEYALISVSDTGRGIPGDAKDRIFEPFFTTKDVGKGTGLGLSMVYGIISKHGGYIDVFSKPGKGTTFKIYMPLGNPGSQA